MANQLNTEGGASVAGDILTGGGDVVGRDQIGRDWIGRDQNIYAGLTTREMFRLRIVQAYEKLWSLMEPLALYARPEPVTLAVLAALSTRMRQWYFQEAGGLYMLQLSKAAPTREAYLALQDTLRDLLAAAENTASDTELDEPTFHRVRDATSRLRHAIADELHGFLIGE